MPLLVGLLLSLGVAVFARRTGLDRDRAFYPTVLIVVALYYVLFAVMSGSPRAVLIETLVMTGFATAAVLGFWWSPWIVAAGLFAHGVMDTFHGHVIANAGVPVWWPSFCAAYDVGAAACMAWFATRATTEGK